MSNYQRLISYIYTYEGGMKGKNAGFAKLETRNSQCRLTVNVKKVFPGGSPLGVYLLSVDGEQRIGTLFSRNGAGEFRALLNADKIEGSGRPLREFYGLSIHEAENEQHSYITIWEDVKLRAAEAAEPSSESRAENCEDVLTERMESRLPGTAFDKLEEKNVKNQLADSGEKENELKSQEGDRKRENKISEKEDGEMEKGEGQEEEKKEASEERKTEGEMQKGQEIEVKEGEEEQEAEQEQREKEKEKDTEEKEETKEERKEERVQEKREKGWTEKQDIEEVEGERAENLQTEDMDGQRKTGIRDTLLCQNSLQSEKQTAVFTSPGMEARADRRSAHPRSRRRPDGSMSAREWAESLAAQGSLKKAGCGVELPLKAGDRAFIPIHDLDDGCSHQRMWARLRRKYPKMLAFDYEPGCEILTIKPQDIGLLPREAWIFGNNSFLLHGYYSYRYLILARLENPDGEPRYLLGVPGHYCSNEKYMASMFGFPDFIMSKKQPSGDDCFGYWYTDVRVGD
ncbi:MAG: hypothetical protein KH353_10525 [Clostridium sp.]|nr:hypothetical protein [Clostridium sp.]